MPYVLAVTAKCRQWKRSVQAKGDACVKSYPKNLEDEIPV